MKALTTLGDDRQQLLAVEEEYDYEDTAEPDAPRDDLNVIAHWEALEIIKAEKLDIVRSARPAVIPFAVMVVCLFWKSGNAPLDILLDIIGIVACPIFGIMIHRLGYSLCGQVQRYAMLRGLKLFLLWGGRIVCWAAIPVALAGWIYLGVWHGVPRDESSAIMFALLGLFGLYAMPLSLVCEGLLWSACIPDWEAAGIRIRGYRVSGD